MVADSFNFTEHDVGCSTEAHWQDALTSGNPRLDGRTFWPFLGDVVLCGVTVAVMHLSY